MGYWKRQYTERPTGKPLFRPDPRSAQPPRAPETSDPPDSNGSGGAEPAGPGAQLEQAGRQSAGTPGQ
jgi:hypothetical protein